VPKRRARATGEELLSRWIRVESVRFGIYRRALKRRGEPSRFDNASYLELIGDADEPLGDVRRFSVQVNVEDMKEPGPSVPPATGAFVQLKPEAVAVVSVDSRSFDRLWALATANLLRHCRLAFTRPHRRSSLIVSASFSDRSEEDSDPGFE
jgi:hypothetical protein